MKTNLMYKKNKKLFFRLIDRQTVEVVMEYEALDGKTLEKTNKEHVVGRIKTPSGSGEIYYNAIQVCGFSEAFDLSGCADFVKPRELSKKNCCVRDRFIYDSNGKLIMKQVKDIQLYFNEFTRKREEEDKVNFCNCEICFNNPCTCGGEYYLKYSKDIKELEKVKQVEYKEKRIKQNLEKQFKVKPYRKTKWKCNDITFHNKEEAEQYAKESKEDMKISLEER